MKTYTSEEIRNKYNKLTNSKQVTILWDALDFMQQYNGRSRFECIALAMGFDSNGDGIWTKNKSE
jgi:hypothetical protein